MNDPFDDLRDAWCQTAKALSEAFLYDNQLPIDEITRQFEAAALAPSGTECTPRLRTKSLPPQNCYVGGF
ncbi:MAG: hypothetical protein Q8T09_01280 [Candidatus Melainabacteria bacterium]|nr:hypothetical protein [Candidatus Melainabacteria bacterium]